MPLRLSLSSEALFFGGARQPQSVSHAQDNRGIRDHNFSSLVPTSNPTLHVMRRRHLIALLAFLALLVMVGLFVWVQPRPVPDLCLVARGAQTNNTGTVCLLVTVTNSSSSRTYGFAFAVEAKPTGGWTDPSLIRHFTGSPKPLKPRSVTEILVPVGPRPAPWRVVVVYFERDQIPSSQLARYWRYVRFHLSPTGGLKFLTTPEMPPGS
jgi:hypothetical protein